KLFHNYGAAAVMVVNVFQEQCQLWRITFRVSLIGIEAKIMCFASSAVSYADVKFMSQQCHSIHLKTTSFLWRHRTFVNNNSTDFGIRNVHIRGFFAYIGHGFFLSASGIKKNRQQEKQCNGE